MVDNMFDSLKALFNQLIAWLNSILGIELY